MGEPQYQILGAMLGYLVAVLVRYLSRQRFWRRVTEDAQRVLSDPTIPIDDPTEAAEHSLTRAQRSQIDSVARTIKKSDPPPTPGSLVDRPFDRTGRYHMRKGK